MELKKITPDVYSSKDLSQKLGSHEAISSLLEKGEINRVLRGYYSFEVHPAHELFMVIEKYFPNAVIIGRSALFYQGLSDYEPEVLELAISRDSTPIRSNEVFEVRRLAESRINDFEIKKINGGMVKILTPERCLFDVAQEGPGTERFVKAINKYFSEGVNFEEIYRLEKKFKGGDLIRAGLQTLKESKNIY